MSLSNQNLILAFEKINNDYINILKYYFRNYNFKIVLLNQLKYEKTNMILFKANYYPIINFEEKLNKIIEKEELVNLSKDGKIIYISYNNWNFEKSNLEKPNFLSNIASLKQSFVITGTKIINSYIFDNDKYNIHKNEEYKKVGDKYNLLYHIYNNNYNFKYQQFYNHNFSLKSINDFINIEKIKDKFLFVIIFLNEKNLNILLELEKNTYKNIRYLIVFDTKDLDLIDLIKKKLSILQKIIPIYSINSLDKLYHGISMVGFSYEHLLFINNNKLPDLNKLSYKIMINNNYLLIPLNIFVKVPYFYSKTFTVRNINEFYKRINWFLVDNYKNEYNLDTKSSNIINKINYTDDSKIPLHYYVLERSLLKIKDYDNLLELINKEIDKCFVLQQYNELLVKKITIAILTEKENTIEANILNILHVLIMLK